MLEVIKDPPPLLFLAATMTYTLAITRFRSLHQNDRYQDRILAAGWIAGGIAAFASQTPFQTLKGSLAWSGFLSLIISSLFHRLLRMELDPDINVEKGTSGRAEPEKTASHLVLA